MSAMTEDWKIIPGKYYRSLPILTLFLVYAPLPKAREGKRRQTCFGQV